MNKEGDQSIDKTTTEGHFWVRRKKRLKQKNQKKSVSLAGLEPGTLLKIKLHLTKSNTAGIRK